MIQMAKQVWAGPGAISEALKQKRLQSVRNEHESERLDRLRNPSKYLGK
jgi:hypothetical protein